MKALSGRPVFTLNAVTYKWEDVVAAAHGQPRWEALVRRAREGVACLNHLQKEGEEEPEDRIRAAAAEYRYERNLISADDAERWLARRGVTIGEWMSYIRRMVLREVWGSRVDELVTLYPIAGDELEDALRVDAICSGEGLHFAHDLAERAAAAAAAGESLDAETTSDRLALIEKGVQRFAADRVTADAVRRQIAGRHLDWIRVDYRAVKFEGIAQAREAALCIREDGLGFDDVARIAHTEVHEKRFYLDELDDAYRAAFVGARPRELVGPIEFQGKHTLFLMVDKLMPSADDPELIRRAQEQLMRRALEEEVERRVKWELGW